MKVCVAVLATGLGLSACAPSETEPPASSDDLVAVGDLANEVSVFPDRLEFDATTAAKLRNLMPRIGGAEPVYMISGREANAFGPDGALRENLRNPNGYLRRAVSWRVQGAKIVVQTEPASLSEAVEEIKKNGFLPLVAGDPISVAGNMEQSWTQSIGPEQGLSVLDFSGKELWNKEFTTGAKANLTLTQARLNIKPSIDYHFRVEHFRPKEASVVANANIEGNLEFRASATGAYEYHAGDTLWKKSYGTTVGKMPLTLDLEVKWECELASSGESVAKVPANATGKVRAGVAWQGQVSSFIDPPLYDFPPVVPALDSKAHVAGDCHLVSTMNVELFDSSGPQVTVDLYAKLDANATEAALAGEGTARVVAGSQINLAGSLNPFGIHLADLSAPPQTFEKEIYSGSLKLGNR